MSMGCNNPSSQAYPDCRKSCPAPSWTTWCLISIPVCPACSASIPFIDLLVLPAFRITDPGFRFYVVEPHVFRTFPVRPRTFACHRTCVTSDAFIKVHYHCHLRFNLQGNLPPSFFSLPHNRPAGCRS